MLFWQVASLAGCVRSLILLHWILGLLDTSTSGMNKSRLYFLFNFRLRLFHCLFCILVVESYVTLDCNIEDSYLCREKTTILTRSKQVDEVAGTNTVVCKLKL